jgi:hypothetical protein
MSALFYRRQAYQLRRAGTAAQECPLQMFRSPKCAQRKGQPYFPRASQGPVAPPRTKFGNAKHMTSEPAWVMTLRIRSVVPGPFPCQDSLPRADHRGILLSPWQRHDTFCRFIICIVTCSWNILPQEGIYTDEYIWEKLCVFGVIIFFHTTIEYLDIIRHSNVYLNRRFGEYSISVCR